MENFHPKTHKYVPTNLDVWWWIRWKSPSKTETKRWVGVGGQLCPSICEMLLKGYLSHTCYNIREYLNTTLQLLRMFGGRKNMNIVRLYHIVFLITAVNILITWKNCNATHTKTYKILWIHMSTGLILGLGWYLSDKKLTLLHINCTVPFVSSITNTNTNITHDISS
jgi:hypothetical protein